MERFARFFGLAELQALDPSNPYLTDYRISKGALLDKVVRFRG